MLENMKHLCLFYLIFYILTVCCIPPEESLLAYNTAVNYHRHNDNANALLNYKLAISYDNNFPEAHQNLGLLYETFGDFQQSLYHHEQSIAFAPSSEFKSSAIVNFVLVSMRSSSILSNEENERLISLLLYAQQLNPADDNIEFTIGLIHDQMGRPEKAMQSFQRILSVNPNHSLALMNAGNHYFRRSEYGLSTEYYERTLLTLPEYDNTRRVLALNNLGQSYREQGLYNAALSSFSKARAIQGFEEKNSVKSSIHFYSINNIYTIQGLLCKWKDYELYEHLIESFLLAADSNSSNVVLNTEINLSNLVDPYTMSLMRYSGLSFDRMVCKSACTASPIYDHTSRASQQQLGGDKGAPPVLRVGYVSFDWRDHPMGRLTSHLVTSHNSSVVHSLSFSYGNNDGSSIRKLVEAESPEFVDISRIRNDFDAAAVVVDKQLDILVDITAHTYNGRINIAALKPAAIVINYLGFPGTTGCNGFDYSLVDRVVVPPESREGFTERLIYLPHSYQANNLPLTVVPCYQGRMACRRSRNLFAVDAYHGIAAEYADLLMAKHMQKEVQWICSFNANKKFEPMSFSSWVNILARVSSAVLILLDVPADARAELLKLCSFHGISHSRVLFIGRQPWLDHLRRTAACDLVLDNFVYGAHTTSSDVLWMHVPILTLRSFGSGRMPSRVAGSILGSLIPPDEARSSLHLLIADTVKEYEDMAVRILINERLLSSLHENIKRQSLRAPTFDRYLMEMHVERSYQAVYEARLLPNSKLWHVVIPDISRRSEKSKFFSRAELELQQALANTASDAFDRATAIFERLKLSADNTVHRIASPWTADSIVSTVRRLYPLRFDLDFATRELAKFSDFISLGMEADPRGTLLAVLDAQAMLLKDCEQDRILFDAIVAPLFWSCDTDALISKVPELFQESFDQVLLSFPNVLKPNAFYGSKWTQDAVYDIIVSHILHNHALCANDVWATAASTGIERFIAVSLSMLTHKFDFNTLQSFGLQLMDSAHGPNAADMIECGYRLASIALVNLHKGRYFAHPSTNQVIPAAGAALSVVFFCYEYGQAWWPGWGPSTISAGQGLGGSEEAVYLTAIELSKLGYLVSIYSEIPEQDIGKVTHESDAGGRILWLHHTNLDLTQSCDVFIAWRYSLSLALGKVVAKRRYLWLHDLVPGNVLPQSVFTEYDGVLVQSSFHKQFVFEEVSKFSLSPQFAPSPLIENKIYIAHNGISLPSEDFATGPLRNDNDLFIYGSAPNRGLALILHAWPQIRQHIPQARLEVYYGFTEAVVKHMKSTMGEVAFEKWHDSVMRMLNQDGITYFGPVDPNVLLDAYQRAGFWLYPTTFQETGCITGIKAMAAGAIPVTSRLQESVLIELTDRFDLGPSVPLNLSVSQHSNQLVEWLSKEWVPALVRAHSFTPDQLDSHRAVMRYEVAQEYTWRNTALKLSALFKRDLAL